MHLDYVNWLGENEMKNKQASKQTDKQTNKKAKKAVHLYKFGFDAIVHSNI